MASDLLRQIQYQIYRETHPICPHCKEDIDMSDEYGYYHVTTWGEDEPKEDNCRHCNKTIFIKESVVRSWTAHASLEEAND